MAESTRPPTEGQLAKELPGITAYITGHKSNGEPTVLLHRPAQWQSVDNSGMAFNVPFTTDFPASMNEDADIAAHESRLASGKLGLVNKNGTVLRFVDFSPGFESMMYGDSLASCALLRRHLTSLTGTVPKASTLASSLRAPSNSFWTLENASCCREATSACNAAQITPGEIQVKKLGQG
jgi:hypothetical protein